MGMISASVLQVLHKFRHPVFEICRKGNEKPFACQNKNGCFLRVRMLFVIFIFLNQSSRINCAYFEKF